MWRNHLRRICWISPETIAPLFGHQPQSLGLAEDYFRGVYSDASAEGVVDQMLFADRETGLPGDLLVKMDRMSMAHSLEARSPLLDHKVVEFAAMLPENQKIRLGKGKAILKQLASGFLPAEFLRRKKQGFSIPLEQWLRGDLNEMLFDYLQPHRSQVGGLTSETFLNRVLTAFRNHDPFAPTAIWALLVLEIWLRVVACRSSSCRFENSNRIH
jgi:asparagine synthase (glutamine-hydrolysing)